MSIPPDRPDELQASAPAPSPGVQEAREAPEPYTPWYASTGVFIGCSAMVMVIFCIIGFIPYSGTFMENVQRPFRQPTPTSTPVETPSIPVSATPPPSPVVSPTARAVDTMPGCVIIWVEHQPDDLGKKSRARVWEQFVSDEVKAAGMTPREFYEQVVEHNPHLVQDDYEFKKGKTYLLPVCQ